MSDVDESIHASYSISCLELACYECNDVLQSLHYSTILNKEIFVNRRYFNCEAGYDYSC